MKDCHALKGSRCAVTLNMFCPDDCAFYKSKKRFKEDFLKTKRYIDSLPESDRNYIEGKYPMYRNILKAIRNY